MRKSVGGTSEEQPSPVLVASAERGSTQDSARANEAGWRGSRDVWLHAAYESLLDAGIDSVRIQPLGKRINLSRTSFYWFFKDREELLTGLLDLWREKNTGGLLAQTNAYAESLAEAILNVFNCWLDVDLFDAPFEHAIRSWALQSTDVAHEIRTADAVRIGALTDMFVRNGVDGLTADVRARTIYLTQIGYISMRTDEDIGIRMKRIPKYVEIFTGQVPEPHELARFFARHNFKP